MALIKCKECGHDVSDKASACPNCGCPIGNVDKQPEKTKTLLWLLVVALLCLIGGGGYYAYTQFFNDVIDDYDKDAIVELNPEFIKSIEKYDQLGIFSEGYAAVRKGIKWGYINTKGEEVIPTSIDAYCVGRFSEGLAVVLYGSEKEQKSFSVINAKGKELFSGNGFFVKTECPESEDVPFFINNKLYICTEKNGNAKYDVYDKDGKIIDRINNDSVQSIIADFSRNCNYTAFADFFDDDSRAPMLIWGIVDSIGTEICKAKYEYVGGTYPDFEKGSYYQKLKISNGVALVMIVEWKNPDLLSSDEPIQEEKTYYGYMDLKGNDTFSEALKEKCITSRRKAALKWIEKINGEEEIEYEEYDVQSEPVSGFDDTASEDYEVRKWLKGRWARAEIDPTMVELVYYVYTFYPDGFNFSYGSEYTYNQSSDRLPYTVNGDVIYSADGSPMLRIDRGRNALVDYDKPEEVYKKR